MSDVAPPLAVDEVAAYRKAASKGYPDRHEMIALADSHEELRRERDAITEAARELLREWSSPGSMVAAVDRLRSVLSDQEGQT